MARATVFLDRDGVINRRIMGGYVSQADDFAWLPGAKEAIVKLSKAGFRLAVISNQQGIALGLTDPQFVRTLHQSLACEVAAAGGRLEEWYVCPHHRDAGCACRKPRPGLLDQADARLAVNWTASFLVGDRDSDIEAGQRRALKTVKIGDRERLQPDMQAESLAAAAAWILDQS